MSEYRKYSGRILFLVDKSEPYYEGQLLVASTVFAPDILSQDHQG